ncbi:matrixin family metalloprotease [Carnobacterium maltaromaticum]|uniref:matrixin family metalloprotease n=1 Tax=Carnobacterium maltaromaticum TaxID=2751 RepID=UPI00295EADC7|nr:matrixin family metalloprotease [Carnobacterium maltaromaticum]
MLNLLTLFLFLSVLIPVKAQAYSLLGGKLINGVGNYGNNKQYYWTNPNLGKGVSRADTAMSRWVNSNVYTPISFRRTTNQALATIDVHKVDSANNGAIGVTTYYVGGSRVPYNRNWYWVNINIRAGVYNQYGAGPRNWVFGHEFGHAMGLQHSADRNSVIYESYNNLNQRTYPSNDEFNGINRLYK